MAIEHPAHFDPGIQILISRQGDKSGGWHLAPSVFYGEMGWICGDYGWGGGYFRYIPKVGMGTAVLQLPGSAWCGMAHQLNDGGRMGIMCADVVGIFDSFQKYFYRGEKRNLHIDIQCIDTPEK